MCTFYETIKKEAINREKVNKTRKVVLKIGNSERVLIFVRQHERSESPTCHRSLLYSFYANAVLYSSRHQNTPARRLSLRFFICRKLCTVWLLLFYRCIRRARKRARKAIRILTGLIAMEISLYHHRAYVILKGVKVFVARNQIKLGF